jgi:hypothetical protein
MQQIHEKEVNDATIRELIVWVQLVAQLRMTQADKPASNHL